MKRNIFIDILKGVCIILVVIGHYVPDSSPDAYKVFVESIYSFHMPAFMWASGFLCVLTWRKRRYLDFQISKAKRLLLPYVVVSIVIITLKLLSQGILSVDNPVTYESYIKMLYKPEAGYFMWFIWALMMMFLLVPLFDGPIKRVVLFVVSAVVSMSPIEYTDVFSIDAFVRFLPFFSFGMCCADVVKSITKYNVTAWLYRWGVAEVAVALWMLLYLFIPDGFVAKELVVGCIGIIAVLIVSVRISKFSHINRGLVLIGECSFVIYLFHTTFQGLAKGLFGRVNMVHSFWIDFVVVVSVGLIIPLVLQKNVLIKSRIGRYIFSLKKFHPEIIRDDLNNGIE